MRYAIIMLCLLIISCGYNPYPSTTKIKWEQENNTTDKTSSNNDTIKSGNKITLEQTFRWKQS